MDISTVTAALSGIKVATDIAKSLKNIDAALATAELKLKVAELVEALADAKLSVVEIRETLDEKDREIARLKQKRSMAFDGTVYWLPTDGGTKEGPFCPQCADSDSKVIRLQKASGGWLCTSCKTSFWSEGHSSCRVSVARG